VGLPSTISRLRRSSTVGLRASPLISGSSIGMSCPAVGPWSMPCATTCNLTASPCPSRGCLWMLLRRRPKVPPHSDPFPKLGRCQSRSGYLVNRTTTNGLLRLLPPPQQSSTAQSVGPFFLAQLGLFRLASRPRVPGGRRADHNRLNRMSFCGCMQGDPEALPWRLRDALRSRGRPSPGGLLSQALLHENMGHVA